MKIIYPKKSEPEAQADPYIITYGGKYYIYATGVNGVQGYASNSIDGEWKYLGIVLNTEGEKEFWAPCVYEENGTFYMYYSSVKESSDDPHDEQIKLAVSSSPEGPFTYSKTLLPAFSIDPHVVKNESGLFMFYSVNDYNAERAGTYIVVQKMSSPTEMEGEPVSVLAPTIDEEIFMRNRFKEGQHWHTLEGAFYFFESGVHYLIYSGNCWESPYYFLGYASAVSGETDLTKVKFQKRPSENTYAPLISANEYESGTGHNSVIKIDGQYYVVYHGRDLDKIHRTARICKLNVNNGSLSAERKRDTI